MWSIAAGVIAGAVVIAGVLAGAVKLAAIIADQLDDKDDEFADLQQTLPSPRRTRSTSPPGALVEAHRCRGQSHQQPESIC